MRRIAIFMILLAACLMSLSAQGETQRYEEFRNKIHGDYQGFRESVVNDYDKFLGGIWVEYKKLTGLKADEAPKPAQQPVTELSLPDTTPKDISPVTAEEIPSEAPSIAPFDPVVPTVPVPGETPGVVHFYGANLSVPFKKAATTLSTLDNKGIAAYWKTLDKAGFPQVAQLLVQYKEQMGLNDYMLYLLARKYAQAALKSASDSERYMLTQFLLVHCGFDARLGISNGHLVLLLPFTGKIYSRMYIQQNEINYYVFSEFPKEKAVVYSYELPAEASGKGLLNLSLGKGGIRLPMDAHKYAFTDGVLKMQGNVNANLIRLLADLPQMDNLLYAQPVVDIACRREVLASLSTQLAGKRPEEALEALLHFVQSAFRYATDDEQFGREKPFFFEEALYYPMCDCEDRAVFFSFLVKELLHLDCHLLDYPGHISTAVAIDGLSGDHYSYKEKTYYIADPTYIGAKVGMCMPNYRNTKPELLIW